jgi:hypothetical protein
MGFFAGETGVVVCDVPSVHPAIVHVTISFGFGWQLLPVAIVLLVVILLVASLPGRRRHVVLLVGGLPWRRGPGGVLPQCRGPVVGLPQRGASGGPPWQQRQLPRCYCRVGAGWGCPCWVWGKARDRPLVGSVASARTLLVGGLACAGVAAPTASAPPLIGLVLCRGLSLLLGCQKNILLLHLCHLLL